ncbi:hypothetical protein C2E21_9392 [Chlorella sorokiniana]|uniref:Uncharacterized protein n=1 Tax=Chlorella sorokiniana TaxID=3076 RepID=A0A2P6TBK6_CHLSO|nr:hypothetical protein C2E21_9392 [Chlorella sorokiniana]|eukprot:PRW05921.1 hypothetical protein C2E21_9392 [Chlorella sorokiniana]
MLQPSLLQERIRNLVQRYGPHWKQQNQQAVIATSLRHSSWSLLARTPEHLLALEAVLQQELGQQPGGGTRLLAATMRYDGRTATGSQETLQQRARSLARTFGSHALLQAPGRSFAGLMVVDTAVWQRALAVWRLLGVADPATLAVVNLQPLAADWLAAGAQAKLAALQRLLPWQPTAAKAVQQCAAYVVGPSPKWLIGRLLFLQQEGTLPLLVADKQTALREWRRQRGLPANRRAEGEPQLVSLNDVVTLREDKFIALLETVAAGQPEQPAGSSSDGGTAERYRAFMAQLPQLPAYQRLLAEGAAEAQRLAALLPPELAAAGKAKQQRQRGRRPTVP